MKSSEFRLVGTLAALSLAAVGCYNPEDKNGDGILDELQDVDTVTKIAASQAVGTITGKVLGADLKPLAGVKATLALGPAGAEGAARAPVSVDTDADGLFAFNDIPAGGRYPVELKKSGYPTVVVNALVSNSAGGVLSNDINTTIGPIVLPPLNKTAKFIVINRFGQPASGVTASILVPQVFADFGTAVNYSLASPFFVAEATANASGELEFTNLPAPWALTVIGGSEAIYQLSTGPNDANGDGVVESAGYSDTITADAMAKNTNARIIVLPNVAEEDFEIVRSNVGSIDDDQNDPLHNIVNGAIYIAFNHVVEESTLSFQLVDETGKVGHDLDYEITSGSLVTLTPQPALALDGKEWNLAVRAVSVLTGEVINKKGFFFSGDPANPATTLPAISSVKYKEVTTNNGNLDPGEVVYVHFDKLVCFVEEEDEDTGELVEAYIPVAYFDANVDEGETGTVGNPVIVGNDVGEKGHARGFQLTSAEYPSTADQGAPLFALKKSKCSTRYTFTYPADGGNTDYLNFTNVGTLKVHLPFNLIQNPALRPQTIWGQRLDNELVFTGLTAISKD